MLGVIPAAGLGTRLLPATKAQPKEMLPVVDRPTIQYVVEEAVDAGITDLLIIVGPTKQSIRNHFSRDRSFERRLAARDRLPQLQPTLDLIDQVRIRYVVQKEPRGLGHAVALARRYTRGDAFAVLLGDDILLGRGHPMRELIRHQRRLGGALVAVERIPRAELSRYGVIRPGRRRGPVIELEDIVEKPPANQAPSPYGVIGRYVLPPEIFPALRATPPGRGGEVQLTDALRRLLPRTPVHAWLHRGVRLDVGTRIDWILANVALALRRPDLSGPLRRRLRALL